MTQQQPKQAQLQLLHQLTQQLTDKAHALKQVTRKLLVLLLEELMAQVLELLLKVLAQVSDQQPRPTTHEVCWTWAVCYIAHLLFWRSCLTWTGYGHAHASD